MPWTNNKRQAGPKRGGSGTQPILGISITPRTIYATLLQPRGDRLRVIRQFTRQRAQTQLETAAAGSNAATVDVSGNSGTKGDDFSLNFLQEGGGGADLSNLFLQSEFENASFDPEAQEDIHGDDAEEGNELPTTFVLELQDLLAECRDIGYENPTTAFCIGAPDVSYIEVHAPKPKQSKQSKKGKKKSEEISPESVAALEIEAVDRATLLIWLKDATSQPFDVERVEFVRMTPDEHGARYLALVPDKAEPVAATLELVQLQSGTPPPPARLIDTEASLYLGLARSSFPLAIEENTAIVRVGTDDTLVVFLRGEQLMQQKTLHSLTSFDPPETICSRILLQQDELDIGTLHNLLVIGEERDDDLVTGLIMFYPDAKVVSVLDGIKSFGIEKARPEDAELSGAMVPAVGCALRVIESKNPRESLFEEVNLLPKRLQKKLVSVSLAWHTISSAVGLFFVVLFFVASFYNQQQQITEVKHRISQFPPQLEMTESQLMMRIDSLQTAFHTYSRSLVVLDTLMIGSDRWTRVMETVSREAHAVTGVWIDTWQPRDLELRLQGNATSRDRVVQFAERLNASIELLTFSEIREWPVYHYSMIVPLPKKLPEAATYLRDRAITELD